MLTPGLQTYKSSQNKSVDWQRKGVLAGTYAIGRTKPFLLRSTCPGGVDRGRESGLQQQRAAHTT